ncbi:MAG: non-heme iron oxygenase ferredoxin subunit [Chloroflexi bacterium]|nr:non-heme iron oxygenase ferredoxin subunit [Chloroflexota bacterium]
MPFVKVASVADVLPGEGLRVEIDGEYFALFNVNGQLHALADTCSHDEASLAEGEVVSHGPGLHEAVVECPRHGARFDLKTGRALCLPAVAPVRRYAVKVEGNSILLNV